ncbi:MAG: nodulation protein NfeD [Treponema sp.]|jgi:membrane-bound serine protease (ClpP class)|nr:nodulation protein NfeD [Treponema sp.]
MNSLCKKGIFFLVFCFFALYFLILLPGIFAQNAAAETGDLQTAGDAWIITIRGDIDPGMVTFVRRETNRALKQGAAFLVFEIDTFGGRVDSALQISSYIMSIQGSAQARTVAWVNNNSESMGISWSAGALIALSCGDIYMAAGTSVGAAAPVTVTAGETQGAGEKAVAAVRSQMAALAERNGYPVGIALAMVDTDVELWEAAVDGETQALTLTELQRLEGEGIQVRRVAMISAPGKLLSLTSRDAFRYGLCSGLADTQEELLESLGATAVAAESLPGFSDTALSILTSAPVLVILVILGLVMIFLEINTPGFGVFGLVAVLAFAAVFGSGFLLGRVGSLELILFLAGIGLLAVEIFLIPGFGVVGISGILLIGLSLILSMQDFLIPQNDWEWSVLGRNALVVCLGMLAAITVIAIIALMGPRIRIFDGLTLHSRITGTAGGADPDSAVTQATAEAVFQGEDNYAGLPGKTGRAASTLRPSGKAEIEGRTYTVETEGVFIESGTPVTVIRVLGNRVVVAPAAPPEAG